ncbi:hypothetical protein GC163_17925 [bacterium]|nr:hypothetical protein [bacterium]
MRFDQIGSLSFGCCCGVLVLSTLLSAAEVHTIAGNGSHTVSGDGGPALSAGVCEPFGLEIGPDGALYWAEYTGHVIRRMDRQTQIISTYAGVPNKAGYADGPAATAMFRLPHEVRFDAHGNLFISDMQNHTIRRIDWKTKEVTTVAGNGKPGFSGDGGLATAAMCNQPHAVVLDGDRGFFICDIKNHRIRQVDFPTGVITTVAGTGEPKPTPDGAPVAGTPLKGPRTLAIDGQGNIIIALREGNAIYRWNRPANTLEHLAGNGKSGYAGDGGDAKLATLAGPKGVAIGPEGDIYLADTESHTIRAIRLKSGLIETVVGNGQKGDGPDGNPLNCRLDRPHGVYFGPEGELYIGDSSNNKVRLLK